MPIPKPNKVEKKQDFINRCMTDEIMANEYKIPAQRLAVCTLSFTQTRQEEYNAYKLKKGKK
jgi:hypothetical protein